MKELIVGALQLPTLGMNATRLEFYLKKASERDVKIMLFGEYVLNHFFSELESMPRSMIKKQTKEHLRKLKKFAKKYNIIFIAPMVVIKNKKYYKSIAKIDPKGVEFYEQQKLIHYKHWDEKSFFSNSKANAKPMTFKIDGFKIAIMSGFELHIDAMWEYVGRKKVDIVLLPTASTFDSYHRWQNIIKSRAFVSGCYILRANRLGSCPVNGEEWRFYGDTMLVNPSGEVEMMLEDKESMLIEDISKKVVKKHRKLWDFW